MTCHVPDVSKVLIFSKKAADRGNTITMEKRRPRIASPSGEETAIETGNGVYILKAIVFRGTPEQCVKERNEDKKTGLKKKANTENT